MQTARQLTEVLGGHGNLRIDKLIVRVRVDDIREVFGRTDYLVSPVAGSGQQWVAADRVKVDELD